MSSSDLLGTAEATVELNLRHGTQLTERHLWEAVASGRVPATRVRGRWYLARRELSRVAEILGLAQPDPTERADRRKASTRSVAPATA